MARNSPVTEARLPAVFPAAGESGSEIKLHAPLVAVLETTIDGGPAVQTQPRPRCDEPDGSYDGRRYFQSERVPLRELRSSNPMRPPNWRWEVSRNRVETKAGVPRELLDRPIVQASRLQKALWRCRNERHFAAIESCREPYPQLMTALDIWHSGGLLRDQIEARVLADEDPASISLKTGFEPEVIHQYELHFCDLRSRLDAPAVINNLAIGQWVQDEPDARGQTTLWKAIGYASRSGHVLDQLIYGRVLSNDPATTKEVAEFFRRDAWATLSMRAAIAIRTLPLDDPRIAIQIVRMAVRLEELQRRARRREKTEHVDITANTTAFFNELKRMYSRSPELERLAQRVSSQEPPQVPTVHAAAPEFAQPAVSVDETLDPLAI